MSAFSPNRTAQRRILSLWLPRLAIDRIRRQRATASPAEAVASDADDLKATLPSIVVAKHNNALQIVALDDAAAALGLAVGLPLALSA